MLASQQGLAQLLPSRCFQTVIFVVKFMILFTPHSWGGSSGAAELNKGNSGVQHGLSCSVPAAKVPSQLQLNLKAGSTGFVQKARVRQLVSAGPIC